MSKVVSSDIEKKYQEWLGLYLYHPGYDLFENKYMDHIINLNNIIEEESYNYSLSIYQHGSSGKLQKFLIDSNPKLIEHYVTMAENQMFNNIYTDGGGGDGEDNEEEIDDNLIHLTDNRYKIDMAKKHSTAAIPDEP